MRKFVNWIPPLILVAAASFISFKNYTPGTWLLGWDNLVPELNFKLNIARSLSSVWQEYQGVGLLGGMAHAADLPRQIILWISSLVLPTSFLRYFWTFLMLSVGSLGIYFLVGKGLIKKTSVFASSAAGLVSGTFYLFNLATVQTFFTPFETFISFYGFLPWLLYFAVCYLTSSKNRAGKNLVIYTFVSLFATCAFYVQTLFVVYAIFLLIFAIAASIKYGKDGILRSIKLGLITLCINAFWLLSVTYFSFTSASIPANSHINSIATPETQLMNQARSGFYNIISLKGYWFDYYDWDNTGNYDYLYKNWTGYANNPNVFYISLILFALSVLGFIGSIFLNKKIHFGFSFLVLLGITYFMLSGGNIPWIPFFSDIFRNAYTKWSNAANLIYSVGLGIFVYTIFNLIKNKAKYVACGIASICVIGGSVYTVLPIFYGDLIASSMKVGLPSYYLDTINYFKEQDKTKRIASFPLTDFWGWQFNDWGYKGSGFLWYALPQPILSRTFDVWSSYNEGFYTEISHAIETKDEKEIKYVLNKYQVEFLIFDESINEPGKSDSFSKIQYEKELLMSLPFISKVKQFEKVTIFAVNSEKINSFISSPKNDFSDPFIVNGPKVGTSVKESFADTQGYQNAKNCSVKGQGSVAKTKMNGGNYYAAYEGGVSCDYFYYPTLDYSLAYELRLIGKNISGRSLKFYLYNIGSGRIDKEELLPVGDFDKTYTILPTESTSSANLGYTLSVETKSFGHVQSENLITAIEFNPVEYRKIEEVPVITNSLVVNNVKKYGTWGYKVDVQGYGTIQLGQGYDKGWIGFTSTDLGLRFVKLTHVELNGWANGWVIPVSNNLYGMGTVYLIYWPQILEWGGALLGILALAVVLVSNKKSNTP